ncbi:MAG: exopolysaccharide transport family protein [Methyloligella sp. ZOD6]
MQSDQPYSRSDDIDLVTLGRAIWRAKGWLIGLALAAGFITFVALSMMRPVYTSEARILVENEESIYRRPTGDQSVPSAPALDEQAIQSQVQVITSRDLILKVVKELDLTNDPEFAEDAGIGLIGRLMSQFGMTSQKSQMDKAANAFAERLSVYQLAKSSVIAVAYTSGDPDLAAKAANSLAKAYIEWQREAKLEQTRDATAWLSSQIDALRERVAESEAAVENFRAEEGIYAGSNDVDLTAQQLSELNSKLILAKAQKSEAEARARMIRQMLAENGDIEATPEVLKSGLINALIEQRVQVQRQLAELSATLLPSHPRLQQLQSELADVRSQIRDEARKIAQSLENEAQVADARVQSLTSSLKTAKSEASGESAAEIQLRALQREAKSNRDLLESYLARYRDASARGDVGAVPANATIVSQAYPSTSPSFPKKLPITLLVMVAVALIVLAYVMARELINASSLTAIPLRRQPAGTDNAQISDHTAADPAERRKGRDSEDQSSHRSSDRTDEDAPPQIRSVQEVLSRFRRAEADHLNSGDKAGSDASEETRREANDKHDEKGDASREYASVSSHAHSNVSIAQTSDSEKSENDEEAGRGMSPLDRYLRQRTAPRSASGQNAQEASKAYPVVRNIVVLNDKLAAELDTQSSPAALITPVTASNALPEAIQLARPLALGGKSVLLLDIAQGASTVSDFLGVKRSPGFNELLANTAAFDDVLRVDSETPLQVIPAGNPKLKPLPTEQKSFIRILDALRKTYDCVLIHSDFERAEHFASAMQGDLTVAIALFAPKTVQREQGHLDKLDQLECPFILYERAVSASKDTANSLQERLAAS